MNSIRSESLIGYNIKEARSRKNWSQTDLSQASGISNTVISAFENGKKNPGLDTLAKLAKALEVSIDQLYYGDGNSAFLNSVSDVGHKAVNSIVMLYDLDMISLTPPESHGEKGLRTNGVYYYSIMRLMESLIEFKKNKHTYPDPQAYLSQIKDSVANEINERSDQIAAITGTIQR